MWTYAMEEALFQIFTKFPDSDRLQDINGGLVTAMANNQMRNGWDRFSFADFQHYCEARNLAVSRDSTFFDLSKVFSRYICRDRHLAIHLHLNGHFDLKAMEVRGPDFNLQH